MIIKHPVIAVSASIAAYKTCELVRSITKKGIPVRVMMTKNAAKLIGKVTFEALTNKPVIIDDWESGMVHIDVKNEASVFAVVPATANIIGKMANGIADDAITTAYLAMTCPVIVAPAMNPNMYLSRAVQRNLKTLKEDGVIILDPSEGEVVCGDHGPGKMMDITEIEKYILKYHYESLSFTRI
ncbi:MAG: phosphopantothenoylcysteine decarboxylase [Leptospiraceae bacterium]|nr:phosphopantothenoylcysteine decarboxylase [Leptospiraceae bacterium]MDW7975206.1 flavoprotein [Leptospiraceae bacterium]